MLRRVTVGLAALLVFHAGAGLAAAQIRSAVYASGFSQPIDFVQDPTDSATQYVVQLNGHIRAVTNGVTRPADFLDVSGSIAFGGEQGLLGLAFAPDYAVSGRFFVNFTNTAGNTVVARFRRSANPYVADPASRFDLRWISIGGTPFIAQPFANHNGGNLMFGGDGFLYIGMGDGGAGDDPDHRAQNPNQLLGKMLRIDVGVPDSDPNGYRVPASNPFVGGGALPEIWSFGLRNPWRYSFDDASRGGTGALVIGDVGQGQWEEIDYEPSGRGGRNYGWRNREGAHAYIASPGPAFTPLTDPIHEYDHSVGTCVTGGFVYRGTALPSAYRGRYFFADFVQGRLWSLRLTINQQTGDATASDVIEHTADLGGGGVIGNVSSFGVDASGELYVVNYSAGTIVKIVSAPPGNFVGHGEPQLVWRNYGTGANQIWYMNGATQLGSAQMPSVPDTDWQIAASADVNGDGQLDVVWRNESSGANALWLMNGTQLVESIALPSVAEPNWKIVGAGDFNGDGRADLVWRDAISGSDALWYLNGRAVVGSVELPGVPQRNWQIVGVADLNNDGRPDLVWHDNTTGGNAVWYMQGTALIGSDAIPGVSDRAWQPVAVADLNRDGWPDLIWRHRLTGENVLWTMVGATRIGSTVMPAFGDPNWNIGRRANPLDVRRRDFDGDYRGDILWRNTTTGENQLWHLDGTTVLSAPLVATVPGPDWQIGVTGDFNNDGRSDIIWRNSATGQNLIWYMNDASISSTASLPDVPGSVWVIGATADFNGDGRLDLVWRNRTTGANLIWFLRGTSIVGTASLPNVPGAEWLLAGAGDFDGNGRPDLLWRNTSTGENLVWYLNGSTLTGTAFLSTVAGAQWTPAVVADFDDDGNVDVLWRNGSTGDNLIWYLRGTTITGTAFLMNVMGTQWVIAK